jgi:hypothetical protein
MADYDGRQAKKAAKKTDKGKGGDSAGTGFQKVNQSDLNSSAASRAEGQFNVHDGSLISGGNSHMAESEYILDETATLIQQSAPQQNLDQYEEKKFDPSGGQQQLMFDSSSVDASTLG